MTLLVIAMVGVATWLLTGWFRHYALTRGMVDVPNARSSHRVATPRGGGGGLVLATTAGLAWLAWTSDSPALPGVLMGGLVAAAIGFADDHRPVPPAIRLVGHAVVALLAVVSIGTAAWGLVVSLMAVVFVAWSINLTNFMDGIDGLCGAQTLTVCAVSAGLSAAVAPDTALWFEATAVAAASFGYLIWNWPPARVFMGDVGSGFIGYLVAALTLRAALIAPELGASWLILSGVFITDATFTLGRRVLRRDRLFHAHRSHAYQHLASAKGHRTVTLLVAGINLCWLAPIAALVAFGTLPILLGLAIAYVPLTIGVAWLGAGAATPG